MVFVIRDYWKPTPFLFLEASVYICEYSGYCWDIISKKWLRIIKLSEWYLQYSVSWVLIFGDQSQGGKMTNKNSQILLSDCNWKSRFLLIILKFSNIVRRENRLVGKELWMIFLMMWSVRFLILVTYFRVWLWRLYFRGGGSLAWKSILLTGLVMKALIAKRIPSLWVGFRVFKSFFFCWIVDISIINWWKLYECFIDCDEALCIRSPRIISKCFDCL